MEGRNFLLVMGQRSPSVPSWQLATACLQLPALWATPPWPCAQHQRERKSLNKMEDRCHNSWTTSPGVTSVRRKLQAPPTRKAMSASRWDCGNQLGGSLPTTSSVPSAAFCPSPETGCSLAHEEPYSILMSLELLERPSEDQTHPLMTFAHWPRACDLK